MKKLNLKEKGVLAMMLMLSLQMVSKASNLNVITVNSNEDVVVNPHEGIAPMDTSSVHACVNTQTKVLLLMYDRSHQMTNVNVYKEDLLVSSESHPVSIGDILCFDLSKQGRGEYKVVIENGDMRSNEELSGTFSIE